SVASASSRNCRSSGCRSASPTTASVTSHVSSSPSSRRARSPVSAERRTSAARVQAVAAPPDGQQQRRLGRALLDLLAQVAEVHVDAARVAEGAVAPDRDEQLLAAEDAPRSLHQRRQQLELRERQRHRLAAQAQLATHAVALERAVSMMIGTTLRRARSSRHTSIPSGPLPSATSSSTQSNDSVLARSIALRPSATASTLWPSLVNARLICSRRLDSSSTISSDSFSTAHTVMGTLPAGASGAHAQQQPARQAGGAADVAAVRACP